MRRGLSFAVRVQGGCTPAIIITMSDANKKLTWESLGGAMDPYTAPIHLEVVPGYASTNSETSCDVSPLDGFVQRVVTAKYESLGSWIERSETKE